MLCFLFINFALFFTRKLGRLSRSEKCLTTFFHQKQKHHAFTNHHLLWATIVPPPPHTTSFFVVLLFAFISRLEVSAKMNKWVLNPNELDFSSGTFTTLPWGIPYPYQVENTAYDHNGNVLFHIQNNGVYYPNGDLAGFLPNGHDPVSGYTFWSMINEISIVPVPGSCNQYYVIYCLNREFVGNALKHAIVTINPNGTISVSTDNKVLGAWPGNFGAIAVAKEVNPGERYLYWVSGYGGIFEYLITSSGITLNKIDSPYNGDPDISFHALEAEVSKDGRYLIWVENAQKVIRKKLGYETVQIFSIADRTMWGIEFDEEETGFYVSTSSNDATNNTGGIYHFTFNGMPPTLVSNTLDYMATLIEKGIDAKFYAVNRFGNLGSFVGNGPATLAFGGITVYSSVPALPFSPPENKYYKLPDQIDGEDYSYFYGIPPVDLTSMNINDIPLADEIPPPPPAFYNCNPIMWSVSYTGQPATWSIMIYSVDPATGNQLFGPPYLDYSTSGIGHIPSPIDLNDLGPGLFDDYLGQTFAIKVTIQNECGTSLDFMLCYFRVLGAPPPANINLQINPGNGNPCPASHNITSPCPASIYSASVNMGNSQGEITFYSLKIDEVDCTTGNVIANIYTGPQVPISGVNQMTALGLNDLEINGSTGYFVNKCCRCYRVEATIGNDCGSSTDYSFIKFTVNCNCLWNGEEEERNRQVSNRQDNHTGIRAAPNPVSEYLHFIPDRSDSQPRILQILIFNSLGSLVLYLNTPNLAKPVWVKHLPPGVYTYLLETETGTLSGRFMKK